jgi:hypothetical protein
MLRQPNDFLTYTGKELFEKIEIRTRDYILGLELGRENFKVYCV